MPDENPQTTEELEFLINALVSKMKRMDEEHKTLKKRVNFLANKVQHLQKFCKK